MGMKFGLFSVSAIAAIMMTGSAMAADFGGSYGVLSVGGNHFNAEMDNVNGSLGETEDLGMIYGVSAGHLFDAGGGWYVGPEFSVSNGTAKATDDTSYLEQGWSFGASAVAGYQLRPDVLTFAKIGYVATEFELSERGVSDTDYAHGLSLGFGYDYALTNDWSLRTEYQFATYDSVGLKASANETEVDPTTHSVRMGVGYRF